MNPLNSLEYRKAFSDYLRRGVPIRLSLKAEDLGRQTTHYIWRTRGDPQVRPSHIENNGKLFAWDNPPETGHPGEDYGCRCTAEPYERGDSEYAYQTITSDINDWPDQWSDVDLVWHYYFGHGRGLTLAEIGHLAGVIHYFFYTLNIYDRINAQIVDAARKVSSGDFHWSFTNSYDFVRYLYVFGGSVVSGDFSGNVLHENGVMIIEGEISYQYSDEFTDPFDIREGELGSSTLKPSSSQWTEAGGTHFPIAGSWVTSFKSEVKLNAAESMFQ